VLRRVIRREAPHKEEEEMKIPAPTPMKVESPTPGSDDERRVIAQAIRDSELGKLHHPFILSQLH
jgi:hypothetical protein